MSDKERQSIEAAVFEPLNPQTTVSRKRIPLSRWLLGVVLLVFAVAIWFLLTARSMEIVVIAEGESTVQVSGLALPFGDRYLLRPGTYGLDVQVEGYHPFRGDLVVNRDARGG